MELSEEICRGCVARVILFTANFHKIALKGADVHPRLPAYLANNIAAHVEMLLDSNPGVVKAAKMIAEEAVNIYNGKPFSLRFSLPDEYAQLLMSTKYPNLDASLALMRRRMASDCGGYIGFIFENRTLVATIARFMLQRRFCVPSARGEGMPNYVTRPAFLSVFTNGYRPVENGIQEIVVNEIHELSAKADSIRNDVKAIKRSAGFLESTVSSLKRVIDKLVPCGMRKNPPKRYANYSISIPEAAAICRTSESTFKRRLEESDELRRLMREPQVDVCRTAVRNWWSIYVAGRKSENAMVRAANRPQGGMNE